MVLFSSYLIECPYLKCLMMYLFLGINNNLFYPQVIQSQDYFYYFELNYQ